jgi:hypothetical protein
LYAHRIHYGESTPRGMEWEKDRVQTSQSTVDDRCPTYPCPHKENKQKKTSDTPGGRPGTGGCRGRWGRRRYGNATEARDGKLTARIGQGVLDLPSFNHQISNVKGPGCDVIARSRVTFTLLLCDPPPILNALKYRTRVKKRGVVFSFQYIMFLPVQIRR